MAELATFEERNGRWVVIYAGAVVGRHAAKFKAREQANTINNTNTAVEGCGFAEEGEPQHD